VIALAMVVEGNIASVWSSRRCSKSRYKGGVIQGTEGSVQSDRLNARRGERSCSFGLCFCHELPYKRIKCCKQDNSPKRSYRE
jgi:hypothetical protein